MRMRSRVVSTLVPLCLGNVDFQHRREILLAHLGRLHLELLLSSDSRTTLSRDKISTPCDGTPNVCVVDCAMFLHLDAPASCRAAPRCCVAERTCTTIVLDHEHETQKQG